MVDPLSYFSLQPVLHDWCNKGCGMFYPVCGMVHIKEPLLPIGKSSLCGSSGFHLSLSVWSFTIWQTALLNKIFPSFLVNWLNKMSIYCEFLNTDFIFVQTEDIYKQLTIV